jgi:hypothetical protein
MAPALKDDPVEAVGAPGDAPPIAMAAAGPSPTNAATPLAAASANSAAGAGTMVGPASMPLARQPDAAAARPFAPLNPLVNPAAASHAVSPGGFPPGAGKLAGAPIASARPAAPAAPSAASAPDPIAEAPAAIWYVRPASGGQFGPAVGDVMRQWLTQRRVGADSMLWREGWTDWKKAAAVFPALGPAAAASAAPAKPSAPAAGFAADDDWVEAIIDTKPSIGHHAPGHLARSKGKQSNTIVIVSIFLILLCVLLVVVLVTVFVRQSRDSGDASDIDRPRAAANHLADRNFGGAGNS